MTLEQAADIMTIPSADVKIARGNFIGGGMWMKAQILQIINKVSCDFQDERKEVIDQFCDKIYEQLKKVEK